MGGRLGLASAMLVALVMMVFGAGCAGVGEETAVPPTIASPTAIPPVEGDDPVRELTIFYTNDEHGWMAGMADGQGAANLVGLWREKHGYREDGPFLLLSGGDMWTGPAISTWFEGDSMTEVMNAMGYDAAAVGNHEFDFGLEVLRARAFEAQFPLLSANIRYQADGRLPTDIGIDPYTLIDVNGIRVGVAGLTTRSTPFTTNPVNVAGFDFIDYEAALREVIPRLKAEGAELILVPAHVCQDELLPLARSVGDLGIHMLGGGHCNELFSSEVGDIVVLEGGFHLTSYAYATFQFDTAADVVVSVEHGTVRNQGGAADPAVTAVVERWQARADEELTLVVGYTERGIPRRSAAMENLITYSWLAGYPAADVAVTNLGGIRAELPPGEITLAGIIGVMPFNNVLVEVRVTGRQLERMLDHTSAAVAGARRQGGQWLLERTGQPLEPDAEYSLLVNDFMYAGGDGYNMLAEYDPAAYNTAIDWRQPVIDWVMGQNSDASRPIDAAVDALGGS